MKVKAYFLRFAIAFLTFVTGIFIVWTSSVDLFVAEETVINPTPATEVVPSTAVSDESFGVFSAVLEQSGGRETIVVSDLVFDDKWRETGDRLNRRGFNNRIIGRYFECSEETVNDYEAQNKDKHPLENKFTTSGKVYLLSQAEEETLFPKGGAGWDRFHRKFPNTNQIAYLSNVGFNRDKTEALVYLTHQCRTCSGQFYLLKKIGGKWESRGRSGDDLFVD